MTVVIEKLDSFTSEGGGNVIPGVAVSGDKVRITRAGHRITETYYCPPMAAPPNNTPQDKSVADFEAWAIARVGTVAAWQNLLEKCAAQAGTTDNDKAVRYFPRWSAMSANKSKADFEARCTPLTLTAPAIISSAALANVLAQW